MAQQDDPRLAAAVGEHVRRLVQRHPDTSNAVWAVVIVAGFLLVVPVVFGAFWLCAAFRVNGVLGLVVGMAVWLGVFMLLRQSLLWARSRKVGALAWEIDSAFPGGPPREAALECLTQIASGSNEVAAGALARLGVRPPQGGSGVLKLGAGHGAGQGSEPASDPVVDGQVEWLLRPLDGAMRAISVVQWVLGIGGPLAFFVLGCIFEPKGKSVLWVSAIVLVVWNVVLAFVMGMVETPFVNRAVWRFQSLFPPGSPLRAVAMASFSRIRGSEKAKASLMGSLRDGEDGDAGVQAPAFQADRHQPAQQGCPPLETLSASPPAHTRPSPATRGGSIPLEPVGSPPSAPAPEWDAQAQLRHPPSFCTRCGRRVGPGSSFCSGCGAKTG